MTGPHDSTNTRPISVAELLAKNGTIGAPIPNRRRRRRGNSDAVTVAELTGEIPVIDDDIGPDHPEAETPAQAEDSSARLDELISDERAEPDEPAERSRYWSEPEPRWPQSPSPRPGGSRPQSRQPRPERSPYPLPSRGNVRVDTSRSGGAEDQPAERSGAERMNPDPVEDYAGMSVDVMDTDVRDAELAGEDSAYVRSYLRSFTGRSRGKGSVDDVETHPDSAYRDVAHVDEEDYPEDLADDLHEDLADDLHDDLDHDDVDALPWSRAEALRAGGIVVLQSILAVAFGAGLFIAFDELWRWNNIVALVLSVLVILGLVVGVRVVRKTEDIGSTLIAVAVGALVTLGPLALLQSG
jgi:hypothetical protein